MTFLSAPLLPPAIVAAAIVVVLVGLCIKRSHRFTYCVSLVGLASAGASSWWFPSSGSQLMRPLFMADTFGSFYGAMLLSGTFAFALILLACFTADRITARLFRSFI